MAISCVARIAVLISCVARIAMLIANGASAHRDCYFLAANKTKHNLDHLVGACCVQCLVMHIGNGTALADPAPECNSISIQIDQPNEANFQNQAQPKQRKQHRIWENETQHETHDGLEHRYTLQATCT